MHALFVLSTAFTLWMLYDAMQRGMARSWLCIICVPGGELLYFFSVKLRDWRPGVHMGTGASASRDIDKLRYRMRENPCVDNHVALAEGLYAEREYCEASELCRTALRMDDSYAHAHYGLGRCLMALGELEEAEQCLSGVVERDRAFAGYEAWLDLAEVLKLQGRKNEAIASLESLVRANPRIEYSLRLARHLSEAGRNDAAAAHLRNALEDLDHAPRHVRRLGRPLERQVREFLSEIA